MQQFLINTSGYSFQGSKTTCTSWLTSKLLLYLLSENLYFFLFWKYILVFGDWVWFCSVNLYVLFRIRSKYDLKVFFVTAVTGASPFNTPTITTIIAILIGLTSLTRFNSFHIFTVSTLSTTLTILIRFTSFTIFIIFNGFNISTSFTTFTFLTNIGAYSSVVPR